VFIRVQSNVRAGLINIWLRGRGRRRRGQRHRDTRASTEPNYVSPAAVTGQNIYAYRRQPPVAYPVRYLKRVVEKKISSRDAQWSSGCCSRGSGGGRGGGGGGGRGGGGSERDSDGTTRAGWEVRSRREGEIA
jgi:uncharacterized membrane protein YgcG